VVRVRVSRVSKSVRRTHSTSVRGATIESLADLATDCVGDAVGAEAVAPRLEMDLRHSRHAKRVPAKVADVIREGDVGRAPLAATTASIHLLKIDPFGRIASAVDVADAMSVACYLADPSCVEQGPLNWQRAA